MFVCDCSFTDQKWYRSSLPTSRQSAITYRGQAATSNNQTRKYGRRVDFSLDDMIRDTSEADFSLDDYIRDTSEVISLWTVSSEIHRKRCQDRTSENLCKSGTLHARTKTVCLHIADKLNEYIDNLFISEM